MLCRCCRLEDGVSFGFSSAPSCFVLGRLEDRTTYAVQQDTKKMTKVTPLNIWVWRLFFSLPEGCAVSVVASCKVAPAVRLGAGGTTSGWFLWRSSVVMARRKTLLGRETAGWCYLIVCRKRLAESAILVGSRGFD